MKSENGFDVSGWDGDTFLWERINEMGDEMILKMAEERGFWSEDEEPNMSELRELVYDSLVDET